MTLVSFLLKQFDEEAETTRKMLAVVPTDKYDWKPHAKSMTIKSLATHVAELPTWIPMVLTTDELDFATSPYEQVNISNTPHLLEFFEQCSKSGREALASATDEQLKPDWTLRNGDQIYSVSTKGEVIRMTMSQIIHHRAQLGVFLRLLDIPIPGSYGPSADQGF